MEASAQLLIPTIDIVSPVISIVIPTMNESINIVEFIEWVHEGLAALPVPGEILIIDSSTDDTATKALECGARVLVVPCRGLGRAYIDAIPYIRGNFVVMGDADCTYDFRELSTFYNAFQNGANYVMGSRYRGSIEKGAMPIHHQYLGTPVTTWVLNRIFGSHFSDIHCGMRGISLSLLKQMNLNSQSWEYASEMVIKSIQMKALIQEVPVKFYKDRNGRESHHKREGWFSPFKAAWINLKAMFVYGASSFLKIPGKVLTLLGAALLLIPAFGPVNLGFLTFSIYWQLLGAFSFVMGVNSLLLAETVDLFFDYDKTKIRTSENRFAYNRNVTASLFVVISGVLISLPLVVDYFQNGMSLRDDYVWHQHFSIIGLSLISLGCLIFVHTLVNNALRTTILSQRQETND